MKSWPFEQARLVLKHVVRKNVPNDMKREAMKLLSEPASGEAIARLIPNHTVTFETGYGPSGAPHIGTFGEVVRTDMVRQAFRQLTEDRIPTRLIAFSDDYDGLRRVPDGMPDSMNEFIGLALSRVPDPFGEYPSFAARNNAALCRFIDDMGVDYEFVSSTECYESGLFNAELCRLWENYEQVQRIMLPSLREERRATYSPFMPVLADGQVLQVPVRVSDTHMNVVLFNDGLSEIGHTVFNGNVKLQWKPDWAMRWAHFNVDYEMHGKDLIDSATLSTNICKALGSEPPVTYFYELFLDEEGQKISKSKGNGMSVDQWLSYGPPETLRHFMFQSPRSAKELSPRVVPRVADEMLKELQSASSVKEPMDQGVWHVFGGDVPSFESDMSYNLLVNLASVSNAGDAETLLAFLRQYRSIREEDRAMVETMAPLVVNYVRDHVLPHKQTRSPNRLEAAAFYALADALETVPDGSTGEEYQFQVYEIGKRFGFDPLRSWFQSLYEVLFGASQGPRFGSFVEAYGRDQSIALLRNKGQFPFCCWEYQSTTGKRYFGQRFVATWLNPDEVYESAFADFNNCREYIKNRGEGIVATFPPQPPVLTSRTVA